MNDADKNKEQLISELAEIRQKAEALEHERQRLALILDTLPAKVCLIGPDHSLRYSNRFFRDNFGSPDERACYDVFYGRTNQCETCNLFKIVGNIKCEQNEYTYPDGKCYCNYDYPFIDIDNKEVLLSFGLDITGQKKAEAALLQSEEKFFKAFRCNPDLMAISTLRDGRYIDVNDAFIDITGYQRPEIIGHTSKELGIWADHSQRNDLLNKIQELRQIKDYELQLRLRSGEVRDFCLAGVIIDIDGESYLLNSSHDITEDKRTLKSLRQSEEWFAKAFNASPVSITITTLEDGRFIKVNDAFCHILGIKREDAIGKTALELEFWVDCTQRYLVKQKLLANQSVKGLEICFRKKNGAQRLGLYSAESLDINGEKYMLGILMDMTELRKMEAEMTRLDRLNLVGEMAASIGHEIRNPMTTVRGYLQLLQQRQHYHDEMEYFDLMIEELDRANSIITEFLSLAKNKMVELIPDSLNSIINKLLPLLDAKAMSRDQHIKIEMDIELPDLLLDQKEIRQLLLNLVNNGMEAMAAGGYVTIKTFAEDGEVVLAVRDEGRGIHRDVLDKLGTPFFTTKEQGTGLGLAVCYRIAARHNAQIDVETSPLGTTFYVRFPGTTG